MSVFETYEGLLKSYFSDWISVNDKKSGCGWTIEDFPNGVGVDDDYTKPHCWKCVTVNQCWFKNENNKKPKHFDYSDYSFGQIMKSKRGLYHPNCHCKEKAINVPNIENIKIINLREKFNDFLSRKKKIFYGIGYTNKDENMLMSVYSQQVKDAYRRGNYILYKHWEYGFQVNMTIKITGKNNFKNKNHYFKTGIFIYPDGKLKISTVFAGGVKYENI